MVFGLGQLIYVMLLLINAVAILSEDRFLARLGWAPNQLDPQSSFAGNQDAGLKARLVNLISAVRTLLRIPLIVANVIVIVYELILG